MIVERTLLLSGVGRQVLLRGEVLPQLLAADRELMLLPRRRVDGRAAAVRLQRRRCLRASEQAAHAVHRAYAAFPAVQLRVYAARVPRAFAPGA